MEWWLWWWEDVQESMILSLKAKMFNNPPHTQVRGCKETSKLVMVLGEVFSIVGGLTSHKHVPVFKDLLFGQHLVLRTEDKGIAT